MHSRPILLSSLLFTAALAHPLEYGSTVFDPTMSAVNAGVTLNGTTKFKSASSFIVIPQLSGVGSVAVEFFTSIGLGCHGSSFGAAVICADDDGNTSCEPLSWYPGGINVYGDLTITPGDMTGLEVIMTSTQTANVYLSNGHGDYRVDQLTSTWDICQTNVQWGLTNLIDDGSSNAQVRPLANFTEAIFQWVTAVDVNDQSYAPDDNPIISNIKQDIIFVTSTRVAGSDIIIDYS